MNYRMRLLSALLVVAMVVGVFVIVPTATDSTTTINAVSDADFVAPNVYIPDYIKLPDDNLLTNNTSFIMAQGTAAEIKMTTQFITSGKANRPGNINYQKYIVIHNTGAYPSTSTALANHNYGRTTTADVSWHYTCGNDGLYQMLPLNERGWHAGGNYWGSDTSEKISDLSNSTGIGIETATPGIPADDTFSGVHWNQDDLYEWYETVFDKTATYLAMLVAYMCVKLNFNPYTQVGTHYHAAGKNCPEQMRYVFGTNASFKVMGTYYKVMLARMYDYYKAWGGSYVSTDTCQNTYYNPNYAYYKQGLYKAKSTVTVYRAGNTATGSVGSVASGTVVDAKITGWNWGKITLDNGKEGWVNLNNFTFVRNDYDYGTYKTSSGAIVEVNKIDGSTAYWSGGSAALSTLTRVYAVTVTGDTTFGSTTKYLTKGSTFTVTAETGGDPFKGWEVRSGIAQIASKTATSTTITVLNSDFTLVGSYKNEFSLSITNGVGGGLYKSGTTVEIAANQRIGYEFTSWSISSGSATIANTTAEKTTLVMGKNDVKIVANYKSAATVDTTGLTNYAKGKSYTTVRTDGAAITYHYAAQADSGAELTDGIVGTSDYGTSSEQYVSLAGTAKTFSFTIDLGQERKFNKVVVRDTASNGASIGHYATDSILLEYSVNGKRFAPVTNMKEILHYSYSGSTALSNYTHEYKFDGAQGRYVRVSFTSTVYVTVLSELEVYGSDSITAIPNPDLYANLDFTDETVNAGVFTKDDDYVYGTSVNTTVSDFTKIFQNEVTVKDTAGNVVTDTTVLGTGYTVSTDEESLTIVVKYDITGDGDLTSVDILSMSVSIKGSVELKNAFFSAGDIDGDKAITSADYTMMRIKLS